jgi:HprK-related kinase A
MASGWRLLSDEFGIIRMDDGMLLPLPRPIPLKNASIPVIQRFAPEWEMGPVYPKTRKGDVCHMKPSADSLERSSETAIPSWVIFPRYQAGADASLRSLPASEQFARLSLNSFNYQLKAQAGFDQVARMISECEFYTFEYDDLTTAVAALDRLIENCE